MLLECCTQYARKFGTHSNVHRTAKGQFSFQSQRKAMLKNVHIIIQLHLFHMLEFLQTRLQQYVNQECPDVQAGFQRGRGTRAKIENIHWIMEKAREFQKSIYSASLTT